MALSAMATATASTALQGTAAATAVTASVACTVSTSALAVGNRCDWGYCLCQPFRCQPFVRVCAYLWGTPCWHFQSMNFLFSYPIFPPYPSYEQFDDGSRLFASRDVERYLPVEFTQSALGAVTKRPKIATLRPNHASLEWPA